MAVRKKRRGCVDRRRGRMSELRRSPFVSSPMLRITEAKFLPSFSSQAQPGSSVPTAPQISYCMAHSICRRKKDR
ncbi:hypothetical protein U1Q18_010926 [Sarracenia purpurea var. burkii]